LNLVTAGHPATQEEKIRILGIRPLFTRIIVVDPSIGERKGSAFSEIMRESRKPPARHLSIGNRVETDIAEARSLGWKACWVRYGEHAAHEPANESEQPDFTIHHISELVSTCRL
jgi:putative hydrolase of the HAD superfamily